MSEYDRKSSKDLMAKISYSNLLNVIQWYVVRVFIHPDSIQYI